MIALGIRPARAYRTLWDTVPSWSEPPLALRSSGPAGLAGGADALLADAEHHGQHLHGSGTRLGLAVQQVAQGPLTDPALLGELNLREPAGVGFEQGAESCGTGHAREASGSSAENLQRALDSTGSSADAALANETTPAAAHLTKGEQRPRPNPNPKAQAMTTVAATAPAAQPLLTYSPTARLTELLAEREARFLAATTADVLAMSPTERTAALDTALSAAGDHLADGTVFGIAFRCAVLTSGDEPEPGDIEYAAVDDAEDFVAHFGGPVTHARALAILRDGGTPEQSRQIERAAVDAVEDWATSQEPDFSDYDGPEWNDRDDRGCL